MIKMTVSQKQWPINGTFTISRGSKKHADTVWVTLEKDGIIGRGECVPYARYGESVEQVMADLNAVRDGVENLTHALDFPISDLHTSELQKLLPAGAARNALDCAWWDLHCKYLKKSIWELRQIDAKAQITAFTLSLDTPEKMGLAAKQNASRDLLKLKLAGEGDIERVAAVRANAPNANIIVDANEGWTIEQYHQMIPELQALNVSMIEQPFPSANDHWLDGLDRPIPICADESCHDVASLASLVGRFDMINIKLDKTGGLTEALALKAAAQAHGLKIMVGCMVASSLAMAPAFVVAQNAEVVDLDGPLLLAEDIPSPFQFNGSQMLPMSPKLWG